MSTQLAFLRKPPSLPDRQGVNTAHTAYLILRLNLISVVGSLLVTLLTGTLTLPALAIAALAGAFTLLLMYWLHGGHVRRVIYLIQVGYALAVVVGSFVWNGAYSPISTAFMLMIVGSGVLLGRRATLVMAIFGAVTVLGLALMQTVGIMPPTMIVGTPLAYALFLGMFFLFEAGFLIFAIQLVTSSIEQVRGSERKLTEALINLQATTTLRNYFDNVLRSINSLLIVVEPDGLIIRVNPAVLKLLEYTEMELIGMPIQAVFTNGGFALNVDDNPEGETTLRSETEITTRSGKRVPIAFSQSVLRTEDGDIEGLVVVAEDISERRAAETERLRNAMRYRALFEQSNDAIFLINLEGKHIAVNQRASNLLGYSVNELIRMGYEDIIIQRERPKSDESLQRLLAGKTVPPYERIFRHKDGTEIAVEVNVELVRDADGRPLHIQSLLRDIRERKRAEAQLAYQAGLLQNVNDAIISTDMSSVIQSWNRAAEQVYGWKAEEVIGKTLSEVIPTEFSSDSEDFIRSQYIVRGYWRSEVKQKDREGRPLVMLSSVSILRDKNNELIGTVTVNHDITARKQAEMELHERVTQLAALRQVDVEINSSLNIDDVLQLALHAAALLADADAGFIMLQQGDGEQPVMELRRVIGGYMGREKNAAALAFYGVVGRTIRRREPELIPDVHSDPDYVSDIPETVAQMAFPLLSGDRLTGVLNLETGRPENFTRQKFDFMRIVTNRIAIALDNARLYQLSQDQLRELQTLYEQVRALEALKTDMMRIASHDLRNPIGVIKGYLDLLSSDLADRILPAEVEYMDTMRRATNRAQSIISDILSADRYSQNTQDAIIDLPEMTHVVIDASTPRANEMMHTVIPEITTSQLLIQGDPAQLHEAMLNLVDNAIKYTPKGGQIEVRLCRVDELARFEVEDNGYGIPEDLQPNLFKPFYRAKSVETREIDGTGLGLHLVKNIIERHGGKMLFRSVYGKGSLFGFEIPVIPGT